MDAHSLIRSAWLDTIVRIAFAKHILAPEAAGGLADGKRMLPWDALLLFLSQEVRDFVTRHPGRVHDGDGLRKRRLYTQELDTFLLLNEKQLMMMFKRYAGPTIFKGVGRGKVEMDVAQWHDFLDDTQMQADSFPITALDLTHAFVLSKLTLSNELTKFVELNTLLYTDWLEALCRIADIKFGTLSEDGSALVESGEYTLARLLPLVYGALAVPKDACGKLDFDPKFTHLMEAAVAQSRKTATRFRFAKLKLNVRKGAEVLGLTKRPEGVSMAVKPLDALTNQLKTISVGGGKWNRRMSTTGK